MQRTRAREVTIGGELYPSHNTGFLDDIKVDIRLRIGAHYQLADRRYDLLHEIVHALGRERPKLSRNGELMAIATAMTTTMPEAQMRCVESDNASIFRFYLRQRRHQRVGQRGSHRYRRSRNPGVGRHLEYQERGPVEEVMMPGGITTIEHGRDA